MKAPIILVDQDGVFADFVGALYRIIGSDWYHPRYLAALPNPDELQQFYVEDCVDDPELKGIIQDISDNHPRLFESIQPFPGAIEGMQLLRAEAAKHGIGVCICTAPSKQNKPGYTQKAKWVAQHLGEDWLDHLIMTRDKTLISGLVLIDDKPEPLGKHQPAWGHVVFDRSYNRHVTGKERMLSWEPHEVGRIISHALELTYDP